MEKEWLQEELQMAQYVLLEMTEKQKAEAGTMVSLMHYPSKWFLQLLKENGIYAIAVVAKNLSGMQVFDVNGTKLGSVNFQYGEEQLIPIKEKIAQMQKDFNQSFKMN